MRCPACSAVRTRVIDSRPIESGSGTRRRRRCPACDHRFTTYERPAAVIVSKRDGRQQHFDPEKIRSGLNRALADRRLSEDVVDHIVRDVTQRAGHGGQVTSDEIGQWVLGALRTIDEAAYLRFASVYKDFEGAEDFEAEMASLDD